MGTHQAFRANVGIVVSNATGEVLAFERKHERDSWQLPQGGVDVGEEPLDAAYRELAEETGLRHQDVDLVDTHPHWLAYELPEHLRRATWRGQVQKWFHFRIHADTVVDLVRASDDEFVAYRWMKMSELSAIVWRLRQPIYEDVARQFKL